MRIFGELNGRSLAVKKEGRKFNKAIQTNVELTGIELFHVGGKQQSFILSISTFPILFFFFREEQNDP